MTAVASRAPENNKNMLSAIRRRNMRKHNDYARRNVYRYINDVRTFCGGKKKDQPLYYGATRDLFGRTIFSQSLACTRRVVPILLGLLLFFLLIMSRNTNVLLFSAKKHDHSSGKYGSCDSGGILSYKNENYYFF